MKDGKGGKITVSPMTEKDVAYVSSIMQKRWDLSPEDALRETRRSLASDRSAAGFCARLEGRTIGVGLFDEENADVTERYGPWVLLLWVEPEFRGRGIGELLTKARMDHARRHGYTEIYLDTIDALPYHEQRGWKKIDTVTYKGETDFIMKFDLSEDFPAGLSHTKKRP